jgi:hypothetical protein
VEEPGGRSQVCSLKAYFSFLKSAFLHLAGVVDGLDSISRGVAFERWKISELN